MAFFDDYSVDSDIETRVRDSFTTTTNNSANLNVGLEGVGNETTTVENAGNLDVGVDGSFHSGSHNVDTNTEHSGNTGSYNLDVSLTDESTNNDSINAGVREYNTGFGGELALGGGGGAGGDLTVENHSTIVDQSVNQNILSGHGVYGFSGSESVVASGEGAMAAGDDIDVEQTLIGGTHIDAGGDVLIGSTSQTTVSIGSENVTEVDVEVVDNSIDADLDNVGNEYSATLDIDNSFNDDTAEVTYEDWDLDANVIWDSEAAGIAEDVDIEL